MMSMMSWAAYKSKYFLYSPLIAALFLTILFKICIFFVRPCEKRPPGPRPLPLVGNLFDFPTLKNLVSQAQTWKKEFGKIVYLSVFGNHLVILNDVPTASEFFERRGVLYSGRPHIQMVGELCGFNRLPAIASDGMSIRLRELRKVLNSEIGVKKCDQYEGIMEDAVAVYLNKLLAEPEEFVLHNRWFTLNTIMLVSYGCRVSLKDDYHINQAERIMSKLSRDSQPGAWLVDVLPIMRYIPEWFPGAYFKQYARRTREELDEWVTKPWELVKSQKINTPSFSSRLMDRYPDMTREEEDIIIWSAASIYSAGSDTTVSAITTFFLAMAMFPSVLRAAQREIDSVIGSENRLPKFSDQINMPYTNALLLEIFRWGSILPLGAPRRSNQRDVYNECEIPKGATIIANIWGMCHQPETYPDPAVFDPSRFLGAEPQPDPREVVFGFGRRICPGRFLAEKTLFISIATTIHAFKIMPFGNHPLSYGFDDGFITHPVPFRCNIAPRSSGIKDLIRSLQPEE